MPYSDNPYVDAKLKELESQWGVHDELEDIESEWVEKYWLAPPPVRSKILFFFFAVISCGVAVYFFYNVDVAGGIWKSIAFFGLSILFLTIGIYAEKASYRAEQKYAEDMDSRAKAVIAQLQQTDAAIEIENSRRLASKRRALEASKLEADMSIAKDRLRRLPFELERQYQESIAQYELRLSQLRNQRAVAEAATEVGLDVPTYLAAVLEREQRSTELEYHKVMMLMDGFRKQLFDELDFKMKKMLNSLTVEMADLKNLMPQHQLKKLNKDLSDSYAELEGIIEMPEGWRKKKEIKRVRDQIKAIEGDIYGRQRLLSSADGDDV